MYQLYTVYIYMYPLYIYVLYKHSMYYTNMQQNQFHKPLYFMQDVVFSSGTGFTNSESWHWLVRTQMISGYMVCGIILYSKLHVF